MSRVERTVVVCGDVEAAWDEILAGSWLGDAVQLHGRRGADGIVHDGEDVRHLVVEDVEERRRLVFRWWSLTPDGVGPASRVELDLEPDDEESTRLYVIETPVAPATPLPASGPLALASI